MLFKRSTGSSLLSSSASSPTLEGHNIINIFIKDKNNDSNVHDQKQPKEDEISYLTKRIADTLRSHQQTITLEKETKNKSFHKKQQMIKQNKNGDIKIQSYHYNDQDDQDDYLQTQDPYLKKMKNVNDNSSDESFKSTDIYEKKFENVEYKREHTRRVNAPPHYFDLHKPQQSTLHLVVPDESSNENGNDTSNARSNLAQNNLQHGSIGSAANEESAQYGYSERELPKELWEHNHSNFHLNKKYPSNWRSTLNTANEDSEYYSSKVNNKTNGKTNSSKYPSAPPHPRSEAKQKTSYQDERKKELSRPKEVLASVSGPEHTLPDPDDSYDSDVSYNTKKKREQKKIDVRNESRCLVDHPFDSKHSFWPYLEPSVNSDDQVIGNSLPKQLDIQNPLNESKIGVKDEKKNSPCYQIDKAKFKKIDEIDEDAESIQQKTLELADELKNSVKRKKSSPRFKVKRNLNKKKSTNVSEVSRDRKDPIWSTHIFNDHMMVYVPQQSEETLYSINSVVIPEEPIVKTNAKQDSEIIKINNSSNNTNKTKTTPDPKITIQEAAVFNFNSPQPAPSANSFDSVNTASSVPTSTNSSTSVISSSSCNTNNGSEASTTWSKQSIINRTNTPYCHYYNKDTENRMKKKYNVASVVSSNTSFIKSNKSSPSNAELISKDSQISIKSNIDADDDDSSLNKASKEERDKRMNAFKHDLNLLKNNDDYEGDRQKRIAKKKAAEEQKKANPTKKTWIKTSATSYTAQQTSTPSLASFQSSEGSMCSKLLLNKTLSGTFSELQPSKNWSTNSVQPTNDSSPVQLNQNNSTERVSPPISNAPANRMSSYVTNFVKKIQSSSVQSSASSIYPDLPEYVKEKLEKKFSDFQLSGTWATSPVKSKNEINRSQSTEDVNRSIVWRKSSVSDKKNMIEIKNNNDTGLNNKSSNIITPVKPMVSVLRTKQIEPESISVTSPRKVPPVVPSGVPVSNMTKKCEPESVALPSVVPPADQKASETSILPASSSTTSFIESNKSLSPSNELISNDSKLSINSNMDADDDDDSSSLNKTSKEEKDKRKNILIHKLKEIDDDEDHEIAGRERVVKRMAAEEQEKANKKKTTWTNQPSSATSSSPQVEMPQSQLNQIEIKDSVNPSSKPAIPGPKPAIPSLKPAIPQKPKLMQRPKMESSSVPPLIVSSKNVVVNPTVSETSTCSSSSSSQQRESFVQKQARILNNNSTSNSTSNSQAKQGMINRINSVDSSKLSNIPQQSITTSINSKLDGTLLSVFEKKDPEQVKIPPKTSKTPPQELKLEERHHLSSPMPFNLPEMKSYGSLRDQFQFFKHSLSTILEEDEDESIEEEPTMNNGIKSSQTFLVSHNDNDFPHPPTDNELLKLYDNANDSFNKSNEFLSQDNFESFSNDIQRSSNIDSNKESDFDYDDLDITSASGSELSKSKADENLTVQQKKSTTNLKMEEERLKKVEETKSGNQNKTIPISFQDKRNLFQNALVEKKTAPKQSHPVLAANTPLAPPPPLPIPVTFASSSTSVQSSKSNRKRGSNESASVIINKYTVSNKKQKKNAEASNLDGILNDTISEIEKLNENLQKKSNANLKMEEERLKKVEESKSENQNKPEPISFQEKRNLFQNQAQVEKKTAPKKSQPAIGNYIVQKGSDECVTKSETNVPNRSNNTKSFLGKK